MLPQHIKSWAQPTQFVATKLVLYGHSYNCNYITICGHLDILWPPNINMWSWLIKNYPPIHLRGSVFYSQQATGHYSLCVQKCVKENRLLTGLLNWLNTAVSSSYTFFKTHIELYFVHLALCSSLQGVLHTHTQELYHTDSSFLSLSGPLGSFQLISSFSLPLGTHTLHVWITFSYSSLSW